MTRQGFIDFNTRLSPENSRKASSYAMAIRILDEVLPHQSVINLHGRSLYDISDVATIDSLIALVRVEQAKMRRREEASSTTASQVKAVTRGRVSALLP